jgi:hypothetical protein
MATLVAIFLVRQALRSLTSRKKRLRSKLALMIEFNGVFAQNQRLTDSFLERLAMCEVFLIGAEESATQLAVTARSMAC